MYPNAIEPRKHHMYCMIPKANDTVFKIKMCIDDHKEWKNPRYEILPYSKLTE